MKPQLLDLEAIRKEIEYEWNDETLRYLQERLEHWIACYKEAIRGKNDKGKDVVILPLSVKEDVWCDIFTDVVITVKNRVINKVKEQIKSACEFFLRYKDNPEKFLDEHPEYTEEVCEKCGHPYVIYEDLFNDWLFKLVFKPVLDKNFDKENDEEKGGKK